jgi:hypothetical protein
MLSLLVFNRVYKLEWYWYFRPLLWTSAPLTFSLVHLPPPPPFPVWISTGIHVFIQCVTGGGGIGDLRQINTCRQEPLYWSIFKKSRHLGFGVSYRYLVHGYGCRGWDEEMGTPTFIQRRGERERACTPALATLCHHIWGENNTHSQASQGGGGGGLRPAKGGGGWDLQKVGRWRPAEGRVVATCRREGGCDLQKEEQLWPA